MLIFLIGYMACGKSTIGRKLNSRLNMPLYDTDKEIVAQRGMTIAEIFDSEGEDHFRAAESAMIKSLIDNHSSAIISTGGGAPVWGENMAMMNQAGLTVYLNRSAENICKRISKFGREKRPKLRGLSDDELLAFMQKGIAERDEFYSAAKLVIDANGCTDDQIVERIATHLKTLKLG